MAIADQDPLPDAASPRKAAFVARFFLGQCDLVLDVTPHCDHVSAGRPNHGMCVVARQGSPRL